MFLNIGKALKYEGIPVVLPIAVGIIVAGATSLMVLTLPLKWILVAFIGLLAILPTLVIKELKPYWVFLFLISLPINISMHLTKAFVDPIELLTALGMPPSGNIGLRLTPTDIIFFILLMSWFLNTQKREIYFTNISYFPLLYLVWATVSSVLTAPSFFLSAVELVRQSMYFLLYLYIANNVDSKKLMQSVAYWLLVSLFVEEIATLIMYGVQAIGPIGGDLFGTTFDTFDETEGPGVFASADDGGNIRRSKGTFDHPSHAAMYFELTLPFALVLALTRSAKKGKALYLFLFMLGLAALYVTFSRTALLALTGGAVACLLMLRHRKLVSKAQWHLFLYAAIFMLIVLTPKMYSYMTARPEAAAYRLVLLEEGMNMITSNPISGVGINNSSAANPKFQAERTVDMASSTPSQKLGFRVLHNQYQIWIVETGLIGFILYICFFSAIGIEAFRLSKSADRDISCLSIAILSAYVGIFLHINADPLGGSAVNTLIWIYAGLVIAMRRMVATQ